MYLGLKSCCRCINHYKSLCHYITNEAYYNTTWNHYAAKCKPVLSLVQGTDAV